MYKERGYSKFIEFNKETVNLKKYKKVHLFTKKDRSSFPYWYAHWCAYQLVAINLHAMKFRFLFHDAEKPWLKLFWPYKKVQEFHRKHNRHHLEYGLIHGWDKIDWLGLMIDWECCGFSKENAQLDARDTLEFEMKKDKWKPYENIIRSYLEPLLNKYEL